MSTIKTITSSLSEPVIEYISEYSKSHKMPKNKVIEKAISLLKEEEEKLKYRESFIKMSKDKEMMAEMNVLAEAGLKSYVKHLAKE